MGNNIVPLHLCRLALCGCEQDEAEDTEGPEETSDQPIVKEYNISYVLCCDTKGKTGEIVVLTSPCLTNHPFFSSLLEEINLAPLLKLTCFLWPFLSALFQKAKSLQPEQFAPQSHARGNAWLSCFITGGQA